MMILKAIAVFFGYKDRKAVDLGLVNFGGQGRDRYGR